MKNIRNISKLNFFEILFFTCFTFYRLDYYSKKFKVTPDYMIIDQDPDMGYKMCLYLCIGYSIHNISVDRALDISQFQNFEEIDTYINKVMQLIK